MAVDYLAAACRHPYPLASPVYGICRATISTCHGEEKNRCTPTAKAPTRAAVCVLEQRGFGRILSNHDLKSSLSSGQRAAIATELADVFVALHARNLTQSDPTAAQFCTDEHWRSYWVCDPHSNKPPGSLVPALNNNGAPEYYSRGVVKPHGVTSFAGDIYHLGALLTSVLLTADRSVPPDEARRRHAVAGFPLSHARFPPSFFICPMANEHHGRLCHFLSSISLTVNQQEFGGRRVNTTEPRCLHSASWAKDAGQFQRGGLPQWAEEHPQLATLLRRMCAEDPASRPTSHEVARSLRAITKSELAAHATPQPQWEPADVVLLSKQATDAPFEAGHASQLSRYGFAR